MAHAPFRIFVNYRHDDSEFFAGLVRDELVRHFGAANVAMDIDFPLGSDFREVIAEHVSGCDVFLVVIARDWLSIMAEKQQKDEPDYVVQEIEAAIGRGIPVVPVPVNGAGVPTEQQLPVEIGGLAYKNAAILTAKHWREDLATLVERLDELARSLHRSPEPHQLEPPVPAAADPVTPGSSRTGASERVPARALAGHGGRVWAVSFTADGDMLATASQDGTVRLWASSGRPLATLDGDCAWMAAAAFSPDGVRLAVSGGSPAAGSVQIWDPAAGTRTAFLKEDGGAWMLRYSPDGAQLAGPIAATVWLWDPLGRRPPAELHHYLHVTALEYSPGGHRLASASQDWTIHIWDPATAEQTAVLEGHGDSVSAVAYAPDGRVLASAGNDATVRLWDPGEGRLAVTLEGHEGAVRGVAYSPAGTQLASAGSDGTVRLWDAATGRPAATLTGHEGYVGEVVYSPDGRLLVSSGADTTVRVWDPTGGRQIADLGEHRTHGSLDFPPDIAFSPDGRRLATAGGEGLVRLWDVSALG